MAESKTAACLSDRDVVLKVEGLTVRIVDGGQPGRALVQDISFDVKPGETVCVVGESGSGKSVTSMSIMGLLDARSLRPMEGRILVDGEDVLAMTPARLRAVRAAVVSMIFQEPMTALNPVQTVGRQIGEVLRLHTSLDAMRRREKVIEMMHAVRLPDVERIYHAYPHQLSGGQRQRVVIAMALILAPKVLIADEPTTALDVTTQNQVLTLIRELQQQHGTAVLFVTHDFGVVAEIADRIVVMRAGEVVERGGRDDILARPSQAYTRQLVSSVPSLIPREAPLCEHDPVLQVRDLGMRYTYHAPGVGRRHVVAAEGISFSVSRGEIVGMVGESGSGKSTVARCVSRLVEPTSGRIELLGVDIAGLSARQMTAHRQRVQMVFQDPYRSLNPRRTVGDSIIEGMLNFGFSQMSSRKKAAETLERVGLSAEIMSRYPHQFSGGQRQRICIARALVLEPDLLIADESVSALDVSVQAQVLDLLETLRHELRLGMLFITHDLRVAAQICDTLVVLRQGCIIESGRASDVLHAPTQPYTRALIDAAPGRHWDFQHFRPVQTRDAA